MTRQAKKKDDDEKREEKKHEMLCLKRIYTDRREMLFVNMKCTSGFWMEANVLRAHGRNSPFSKRG